jgi:hypothetical protein
MIAIDPQLEEVARGDIPVRYTHVIGVSIAPSGRFAVVMQTTNEGAAVEFDETVAERVDDQWVGLFDGTPSSTVHAGDHRATILCNYADPLPPDVRHVIVRDRGQEHEVPVEQGYFLYAAWKQDTSDDNTTDPPAPEVVRAGPD